MFIVVDSFLFFIRLTHLISDRSCSTDVHLKNLEPSTYRFDDENPICPHLVARSITVFFVTSPSFLPPLLALAGPFSSLREMQAFLTNKPTVSAPRGNERTASRPGVRIKIMTHTR